MKLNEITSDHVINSKLTSLVGSRLWRDKTLLALSLKIQYKHY